MKEPTHASFFSGVGGLDLGLERAGWRTVSFSEIDPYASAVLAQRWPGVPNLGNIVELASDGYSGEPRSPRVQQPSGGRLGHAASATLWTGGFPCQDLSVAGKRRGMVEGTRSNLAYAFLALAERHRPRFILLENVPGLLSSHGGRDMAALLGALVELGYGVGYRVLDARYFGVPQRRRRVFILGVSPGGRAGAECAAEVLSVGSRCYRHPPTGIEAGEGAAERTRSGIDIARAVTGTSGKHHDDTDTDTLLPEIVGALNDLEHHGWTANAQSVASGHVISEKAYPRGVRAPDGLAGRLDGSGGVVGTLDQRRGGADDNEARAGHLVGGFTQNQRGASGVTGDDPLLPLGLDSHRYRCCGNGVVAPVAEWIGRQLLATL